MRGLVVLILLLPSVARSLEAAPQASKVDLVDSDMCDKITVGPNHEPAVQCVTQEDVTRPIAGEDMPAFRVVSHYLVRVARDHRAVTLIDVPVRSQALDGMPPPLNAKRKPWHPFEIARDGMSIVVGDPADAAGCRNRHARDPNDGNPKTRVDRAWAALDRDLEDRICDARGTYLWRQGRFQRK